MRAMRAVSRYGDQGVKLKWVLPAYLLIFIIAYGLYIANVTYSHDRAEEAQRAAAQVAYQTEVNMYETCRRRVENRTEIRGMFTATFDAVEQQEGASASGFLDEVRARLDTNYPALDPAECISPGPPPTTEE